MTQKLTSLAVAAGLVLLLGLLVRSRLERTNRPSPAAPRSEAAALQQLSQEGQLRRVSDFVAERAAAVAPFVLYLPQAGASGVRWHADTVLFADADRLVGVSRMPVADSTTPPIRLLKDSIRNGWVLVVGRGSDGALLSVAGTLGGRTRTRCTARGDARITEELLLDVPLSTHLAGAGLFDVDGALVGMVVRCDQRMIAISAGQVTNVLARQSSADAPRRALGLEVSPLSGAASTYFRSDSGVLIIAVPRGSAAQIAGLRPGDILLAVDGQPISTVADLARIETAGQSDAHRIARLRGGVRTIVYVRPARMDRVDRASERDAPLGIDVASAIPARGVAITSIRPGSVAHAAGLRVGDRITRIGTTDVSSRIAVERLLRAAARVPTFIVVERDSVERGILVPR